MPEGKKMLNESLAEWRCGVLWLGGYCWNSQLEQSEFIGALWFIRKNRFKDKGVLFCQVPSKTQFLHKPGFLLTNWTSTPNMSTKRSQVFFVFAWVPWTSETVLLLPLPSPARCTIGTWWEDRRPRTLRSSIPLSPGIDGHHWKSFLWRPSHMESLIYKMEI